MFMKNHLQNVEYVLALDRTTGANGGTTSTGAPIDTHNCEGVAFIAQFNDIGTTGTSIHVQGGATTDSTASVDLVGTSVVITTTTLNSTTPILGVDIYKPLNRYLYVEALLSSGSLLNQITAIRYGIRKMPFAQSSSAAYQFETHVSPSSGTV